MPWTKKKKRVPVDPVHDILLDSFATELILPFLQLSLQDPQGIRLANPFLRIGLRLIFITEQGLRTGFLGFIGWRNKVKVSVYEPEL